MFDSLKKVMVVIPINAKNHKTQHVTQKYRGERAQGSQIRSLRRSQLENHDGNDDGNDAIAERGKPCLFHRTSFHTNGNNPWKSCPALRSTEIETSGARIHLRHGGDGPPLLLLHGNPLTHVSWHKIAPRLAEHFHVVAADLRGYGDSVGPDEAANNINYSFRAMAQDQVEVMEKLGYREFFVAGHDRGARTTARMCLDHPDRVKAALIDILPNHHIWTHTSKEWAICARGTGR